MAFAESPGCDRLATGPGDAVSRPLPQEREPGVPDPTLQTGFLETPRHGDPGWQESRLELGHAQTTPPHASEAIMRLEQQIFDLWGFSLAANRSLAAAERPGGIAGRRTETSVSTCLSPSCRNEVIAESATDGHCTACGLHHRRRDGAIPWVRVVGPVVVTVLGPTDGAEKEVIDADALRFVGKYMTIDLTRGSERNILSLQARRLAHIVPWNEAAPGS